jgi:signal peptidase I
MNKDKKDPKKSRDGSSDPEDRRPSNPWFTWTRDIVICLILVLLFRANVAEANYIPSPSMEPTLLVSDRIIVDKLSALWRPLQRGDIVVFFPPVAGEENRRWIKRVIGLPGDTIDISNGIVYINGQRLEEPYIKSTPPYSVRPVTLKTDDPATKANEAEYYLLGDNRMNSRDSHRWGPCTRDRIIGRAVFRYWPILKMGLLETTQPELAGPGE